MGHIKVSDNVYMGTTTMREQRGMGYKLHIMLQVLVDAVIMFLNMQTVVR